MLFDLVVVEFFDDFSQIEAKRLGESAQSTLEGLIELLGWKLARTEEKRKPFDTTFISLGVMIDLNQTDTGKVLLRNKPGRVESIRAMVDKVLDANELAFKEALSVKGKIAYAEGQLFGRISAPVAQMLSRWSVV